MTSAIDVTKPTQGHPQTAEQRANWTAAKGEIEDVQAKTVAAILVGSGPPAGVATATFVGQEYLDTTTKQFHRATATGTGGWVKINTGAGLHVSAFGIFPGSGVDNTAAFTNNLKPYLQNTSSLFRERILWGAGDFYFDSLPFNGQNETRGAFAGYYGGYDMEGAGEGFPGYAGCTRLLPNITANPVFMYNERGLVIGPRLKGFTIWGRGSSNPKQCGLFIDGQPKTIDDKVGGVRKMRLSDVFIANFDGRQFVVKGGLTDALSPNDFWDVENLYIDRYDGNDLPGATIIGQFGQAVMRGCRSGGVGPTNNLGPCWYIGQHPAYWAPVPNTVTSNIISASTNPHHYYLGQPTRVVPTTGNVPSGLSAGTVYYAVPQNSKTTGLDFSLASSLANARTATLVSIADAGTGSRFVKLWPTALANDEFTCGDHDLHLLSTGDYVRFIGQAASLPVVNGVQLSGGEVFYCVWTGYKTFKLATTLANAKARTTVTATGGNVVNYGFMVTDAAFTTQYSAFQPKFLQMTAEGAQLGWFFAGVQGVQLQPYAENLAVGMFVGGPVNWVGVPNVSISEGRFATVTDCAFAMMVSSLVKVDLNSLNMLVSGGFYPTDSAQFMIMNDKRQTLGNSSGAVTANWITGANVSVPVTGNITSFDWTANTIKANAKGSVTFTLGGSYSVTLGSNWKGPALGSGTNGQKCTVFYVNDGTHSCYTSSGWA